MVETTHRRKTKRKRRHRKPLTTDQTKAVKAIVKGVFEPKHYNIHNLTAGTSTNTPFTVDLSAIPQGDAYSQRDGDRCALSSLYLQYYIVRDSGVTTLTTDDVRVIVVRWKPDSAVDEPTVSDLLENSTSAGYYRHSPIVFDKARRGKFTLLYDAVHATISPRTDSQRGWVVSRRITIPLKGKRIKFNAGATTGRGKIYMWVGGTQTSGTEDSFIQYFAQTRYRDM